MAAIRYGIAGRPVHHSLSPLLTALVVDHLGLPYDDKHLMMELLDVSTLPDALAWGYAGAIPESVSWAYTDASFAMFRTKALIKKAVEAARTIETSHSDVLPTNDAPFEPRTYPEGGLPTRLFDSEIWINLTSPLKHQLGSGAVNCLDDSMDTKSVNALRWDGRGWWCAGLDGEGVREVLHHHGMEPTSHVLGLCGGGGGARSAASAWSAQGGQVQALEGRRPLEDGPWTSNITTDEADCVVDFDDTIEPASESRLLLKANYAPMTGGFERRIKQLNSPHLDGRWLLVAQHLACWRHLWAPERRGELPSLSLLLTRLLHAETMLGEYAT
ncbi:MAG: hypothetical protein ACPHJD_06900 [Poseidonia sp.]